VPKKSRFRPAATLIGDHFAAYWGGRKRFRGIRFREHVAEGRFTGQRARRFDAMLWHRASRMREASRANLLDENGGGPVIGAIQI